MSLNFCLFGLLDLSGFWSKELNPWFLTWSFFRKGMVTAWDFVGWNQISCYTDAWTWKARWIKVTGTFDVFGLWEVWCRVELDVFFSIYSLQIQWFWLISSRKKAFCNYKRKWFWMSRLINNIINFWKSRKISILMQSSKSLVFEVCRKFFIKSVWFLVETMMVKRNL